MPFPIMCSFLVTSKCNLACEGCSFKETFLEEGAKMDGSGDMDRAAALAVLNDPAMRKLPALIFAGGEPLAREDVFILARAADTFRVLLTNGTLIDARAAAEIESVFNVCVVSLDGCREPNDSIRGEGSYDMAARGLEFMLATRKKCKVSVACVVNSRNVSRLAEFAEEMRELGVDSIKFQLNFLPSLQPDAAAAAAGVGELLEFNRRRPGFIAGGDGFLTAMLSHIERGAAPGCIAGRGAHILISPSGAFSLCCYYPSKLKTISAASELAGADMRELKRVVANCKGCFRYDQHAMLSILEDRFFRIKWKRFFESVKI